MLRPSAFAILLALTTLSACNDRTSTDPTGLSDEPLTPRSSLETESPWLQVDPIPFDRLDPEAAAEHLEGLIAASQLTLDHSLQSGAVPASVALERSGAPVAAFAARFFGLAQLHDSEPWNEANRAVRARLSTHLAGLRGDRRLLEHLQDELRSMDAPDGETRRLAQQSLRHLIDEGAALSPDEQRHLQSIDGELAELKARFDQNLERETRRFEIHVTDPGRLRGLPASAIEQARRDARDRGHDNGWALTLGVHSLFPALRHLHDRELRKALYQGWQRRAGGLRFGQQHDNPALIERILRLRAERASLLGYRHHLDLRLHSGSLGDSDRLRNWLDRLEAAARPGADAEIEVIEAMMRLDGIEGPPQAWDRWYYRQRLIEQAGLDQATGSIDFPLRGILEAAFALSERLWSLEFESVTAPAWHPEVESWQVRDGDGSLMGQLMLDLVHRPGKRGGAWMSVFRRGHVDESGQRVPPVVAIIANFPRPPGTEPVRLSPHQVETVFHELGHALHEMFSMTRFEALAGTQVPADFVEFPALWMERWTWMPGTLEEFVTDPRTGCPFSEALRRSLAERQRLLAGLDLLEQIAAVRLDLAMHELSAEQDASLMALEGRIRTTMDLPPLLAPAHRFDGYRELITGSKDGQAYRSLWAETLAAEAFERTRLDRSVGRHTLQRLRQDVLAAGNGREPAAVVREFLGGEPAPDALLRERAVGASGD
ncbi:M3 family metallopeptidase [Wenzhouxiangella marina]|nr:M3 family metallopeptidase [Wenzhouxiangella marina]MBB6085797.1 peptidyl-dipeptidase Dcp [Wenzhouxiangella marina]